MYHAFYGFRDRPFAAAPQPGNYFPAAHCETTRQTLERCLDRAEGIGVLIGPAGMGKSLLLQVLSEQLREHYEIALLTGGRICTRRALLQAILFEIGLPCIGKDEGDLRLSLIDHLSQPQNAGLILLIDEAHTLPLRLLEELRLLTNLMRNGEPKVRLILCGSPVLEERFTNHKLEALQQRVTARCYLQAWERRETREYIRARIHGAGSVPEQVFTGDALDAIHRATDGIPRLINQLCDHALVLGCAAGKAPLDKRAVEEAWADLQQLPTPQNFVLGAPRKSEANANVIEFGVLDDSTANHPLPHILPASGNHFPSALEIDLFDDEEDSTIESPRLFTEPGLNEQELELDYDRDATGFEPELESAPAVSFSPRVTAVEYDDELTLTSEDDFTSTEVAFTMLDNIQTLETSLHDLAADYHSPELRFHESPRGPTTQNPFSEVFQEEEVLLDPFRPIASEPFHDKPLVTSREGRDIGQLLGLVNLESLTVAAPFESTALPQAMPRTHSQSHEIKPAQHGRSPGITLGSPESTPLENLGQSQTLALPASVNCAPARQGSAAAARQDDDDLIVIEEEASPVGAAAQAIRQDYKILFQRLRQGT